MSIQPRLIQTDGYAVLGGVTMLIKAGLESGVDTLVGAQLDSPARYNELLAEHGALLSDKGVRALVQPDARQAVASLQSAWLSGCCALGVINALGVIDAAGVLLAENATWSREPGSVLLCLSDSDTSEGEAAIALLRRAGWLVVEPALQDEVKSFAAAGLAVSRVSGRPVALALPGTLLRGAATVLCQPNRYPGAEESTKPSERASETIEPMAALFDEARQQQLNRIVNPPGKDEALPLALIAIGRSFGWARQAMAELGLVGRLPILRLGVLTPLDTGLLRRHVEDCQRVLVLDPTSIGTALAIESALNAESAQQGGALADEADSVSGETKLVTVPLRANAGPAGVIEALRPWLTSHPTLPPELVKAGLVRTVGDAVTPASSFAHSTSAYHDRSENPPPGSSLVDLSVVLGRLRRDLSDAQRMFERHRTGPIDLSIFGELDDAAELLLSRWAPLRGGLVCDGRLAGAAEAGAIAEEGQHSVVLMTSRRFFSLGASAIADAVRASRRVVFVIHTEDPAETVGPRRRWRRLHKVNALDMQAIVEGISAGRKNPTPSVNTIDPSDRPRMARLLERLVLTDGVHVVIARRRRGPRYYRKASEVHQKQSARRGYVAKQGCLVHCPEAGPLTPRRRVELGVLGVEPTRPGPDPWTVSVSWSWHDDTVMHALRDPAVGLAILERAKPERSRVVPEDLDNLPEPIKPRHANADAWRATLVGITGTAMDLTLGLLLEAGAAMGYLVRSTASGEPTDGPTPRRADVIFTSRPPDNTPHVPAAPGRAIAPMLSAQALPGQCDLLLGTELAEAARMANEPNASARLGRTACLIDTLLIPKIDALSSGVLPDQKALVESIQPWTQQGDAADIRLLPIAQLAEWLWGHQRYAAWVYLGYLVQRGLVPLTTFAIDNAGQRVLGINDPRGAEAVKVGRKLAIDPSYADRALEHDPPSVDVLFKTLADDLAERAGSRRGTSLASKFQSIVQPLLDQTQPLDDQTRRQIVNTAQRCVYWAGMKKGADYCQRYIDTLSHVLDVDNAYHGYALTRAAVDGLDRAMLIPDEVYLAALLTAPARYRRDRRRFNISLEQGDKITYVHLLRPEFDLFKRRIGFTITLGERALKTVARFHLLRRIRPGWYRTQRSFRDLYLQTLADLPTPDTDAAYRHARDTIGCAAGIVGRGDNRRDTAAAAHRKLVKQIAGSDET